MPTSTSTALNILKEINNSYSQLLLLMLAIVSLVIIYKEYVLKRRPFVLPEIIFEESDGKWFFHAGLVNKGNLPGIAKITEAVLKIGDESYPTIFHNEIVLTPNECQKLAPIGHINETGRKKIIGQEYKINRVELCLKVESKSIGDKRFKYKTEVVYFVDVKGDKPIFLLEMEKLD